MKETRSKAQLYLTAAKRLYMWYFLAKKLNLVLITEFPKSGASWFCQMLRDATGLPFPRNESPKFETCILQGHNLYRPSMGKAIAVMRDGRDIMVSAYYHFLINNDRNNPNWVNNNRSKVSFSDYENIKENLPQFIEYMFTGYSTKNRFHFSWSEFVDNVYTYEDDICIISYEGLLQHPVDSLKRAISFNGLDPVPETQLQEIVDNYSFKKISNREPGKEDSKSFARKGISGDWKNNFSDEACNVFKYYAGDALIRAGYEKDNNWNSFIK